MRILVDFLPLLPRGGGLQNARNLWRTIDRLGGDHEWLALARPGLGLEPERGPHHEVRTLDPGSLPARLRVENLRIPALARSWRADVVWTPMGAGPLRAPVPRVMGWHDSTVAYPESPVHARLRAGERLHESLRGWMARTAARGAAAITVQTATMRRRLARLWALPESRFHLVPNGPSTFLVDEPPAPAGAPPVPTVLVVAEAKPAKNLEIVPEVAAELRRRSSADVRWILTVGPLGDPWTRLLDEAVARTGADVPLERVGRVPHEALGDLYRSASVVFLPSHFESFSATYLEAMHFGVPLVTSDRDFARDLCADAALYADPLDPTDCAVQLLRALDDTGERARLRDAGFRRLADFPDWTERYRRYVAALEVAVHGADSARAVAGVDA
ncbi:MAG: glycosyltransferase [Longimicrobiales bacterium]